MNKGDVAQKAAEWALDRIGCPYSQERRTQENVFDCSSLVARAYSAQGKKWRYGGSVPLSNQEVYDDDFELLWPDNYDSIGNQMGGSSVLALAKRAGDLQFLCTDSKTSRANKITHVAMVASTDKIVHARGKAYGVCTNSLNHYSGKVCAVVRYNPSGALRTGMKGFRTLALQRALNAFGANLTEDGEYGSNTASAVRAYQAMQGLPATGQADQTALTSLNQLPDTESDTGLGGEDISKKILVTGATVHIRTGPGTEYSSVRIARKGEEYEAINTNHWKPIRIDGDVLWISGKYGYEI